MKINIQSATDINKDDVRDLVRWLQNIIGVLGGMDSDTYNEIIRVVGKPLYTEVADALQNIYTLLY